MSGFDWLNVPVNESISPAPPVSFLSDLNLPGANTSGSPQNFQGNNPSNYSAINQIQNQYLPQHQNVPQHPHQHQHQGSGQFQGQSPYQPTGMNDTMSQTSSQQSLTNLSNLLTTLGNSYQQRSYLQNDVNSIPLSLTAQDLTLQELKTYIRWYTNILSRTNTKTITLLDVFNFLSNFKIPKKLKDEINKIFKTSNINIGEFFALLRLISHGLNGGGINRSLVKTIAPVPKPPSILSKKRLSEDEDEEESSSTIDSSRNGSVDGGNDNNGQGTGRSRLDLDSFTTFMLTGERPTPKRRKNKSVKFIDDIVSDVHESEPSQLPPASSSNEIDFSLPMDQILKLRNNRSPQPDEEEVLKDMNDQLGHFQNLNSVDTASIGGKNTSIHLGNSLNGSLNNSVNGSTDELLKPNMTGPAQISQFINHLQHQEQQDGPSGGQEELLKPNRTGPYDMIRMFSPNTQQQIQNQSQNESIPKISLSAFTDQMTGTGLNTANNATSTPSPPPSRKRSQSSPTPTSDRYSPLLNLSPSQPSVPGQSMSSIDGRLSPKPPPPPPRRRGASFSPALPPKIPNDNKPDPYAALSSVQSQYQQQQQHQQQYQQPQQQNRIPSYNQPQPVYNSQPTYTTQPGYDQNYNQNPNSNAYEGYHGSEELSNVPPPNNGIARQDTNEILDDLKALQAEVDRIRDMTGGF